MLAVADESFFSSSRMAVLTYGLLSFERSSGSFYYSTKGMQRWFSSRLAHYYSPPSFSALLCLPCFRDDTPIILTFLLFILRSGLTMMRWYKQKLQLESTNFFLLHTTVVVDYRTIKLLTLVQSYGEILLLNWSLSPYHSTTDVLLLFAFEMLLLF